MLSSAQTVTVTEYPLGSNIQPWGIALGSDGALWFTENSGIANKIGQITTGGGITTYTIPTSNSGANGIVAGPDGALWFLETNKVGRITTGGSFNEYVIPTPSSGPYNITAGPDGALWFTEVSANQIGRITTAGVINEYMIPTSSSGPTGIAPGQDGALWFTEETANKIGRITTAGVVTNEYLVPTPNSGAFGITAGPDGALWFTEITQIGRMTYGGVFSEYLVPTSNSNPGFITTGPDGALWFGEITGSKLGRVTTSGEITEYAVPTNGSEPFSIVTGPDGALWFTELTGNKIGRAAFPALSITKTHTGNFTQGQMGAQYSVSVGNPGNGSTTGVVTVTDTIPTGLSLVSMTGTGWSCTLNTCTRSDVLASNQTYPAITVTVNVASNATSPAVNQAMVSGGGAASASTSDSTVIVPPPPLLSITKTHAADFVQGQANAQYTLNVTNTGGPTSGAVTVTDNIPSGLTLVSMSGPGWNCSSNTCTRGDVLATSANYPAITVTVNVTATAPSKVTNQVTVSGGGSPVGNASDPTNVNPPACSYSFSNSPASVGSGTSTGSAQLVTSLTNCPYTSVVSNNPDWIAITSGSSGSGSGAIGYSIIAANNSGVPRTGSFTVFNTVSNVNLAIATFTINQAAASCSSLTVTPRQLTFGQGGGTGTVNFNTSPCSWSITSNQPWVTLPASSGTGPSFSFSVQINPGATRQATLSINNGALTVAITQMGLVCTYAIADAEGGVSQSFLSGGGSGTITVAAPAGCAWTATASQSFITISGSPSGTGNGSINYSVAPNSGSSAQTGTITIAGFAYAISEQPAAAPNYSCSASSVASPIRPEGFSESVADVVFTCGGQAPSGGLTGDILISFNAPVTNLLLSSGQTDALLLEDEPTAANLVLGTNVFRGLISSAGILFRSVQLAPASGGTFLHTWRITNARVSAQGLAAGSMVQATISIASTAPFTVSSHPAVASVSPASTFSVPASSGAGSGQTIQPVSFTEGFATAFQPRLASGQDPSQAGTVYNSESGYVNTAILGAQTGFATSGTRLTAEIENVPAGVSVYASVAPASGTNAQLVSADFTGAGGFPVPGTSVFNGIAYQLITLSSGVGTATWEVTSSDPTKIEKLTFNLLLVNPNSVNLSGITYVGALAAVSSGAAPGLPSTNLPVPRFASNVFELPPPLVPRTTNLSVAPQQVTQGATAQGQSTQGPALKPLLRNGASTPSNSVVGGTVTWTQVQANTDSNASSPAPNVSVAGTLPATWVITNCTALDSEGICPTIDLNNPSNSYTVNYPSLSPGQTGTIMLTAQSSSQTSGAVEYSSSIDSDLSNSDLTGGSFTANFPVAEIGLNVTLTNASNFSQGQTGAQYSATIANGGSLPTSLPVTATETLPTGLTLVSMAGPGWTCTVSTSSCTRSDELLANAAFPAITVTVNVASNAPATVTNQVVASTGVLQATGSDQTNITPVATVTNVTSSTANGTYGAGALISIQVIFSSAVTVTGTPQLALNSGGTANYSSGSGSTTLIFTYTVGGSDSSAHLDYSSTTALKPNGGAIGTASLTLPGPGTAGSLGANKSIVIGNGGPPAAFFNGQASLGSNVYYLQFPNGNLFGYYSLQFFPIIYHYDMGFEAFIDGGNGGAYLYDFTSGHWFFTSQTLFPYLYDFTLNNWLYYFPNTKNPGHYTTNPRSFANLGTGTMFTM